MRTEQLHWNEKDGWIGSADSLDSASTNLVFLFGSRDALKKPNLIAEIKAKYPNAILIGCSTSGEIIDTAVYDDTIVATAVLFERTKIVAHSVSIEAAEASLIAGEELIKMFDADGLKHVFVLSDGLNVNGSQLVKGMRNALPEGVSVTGGLAGDGSNFAETVVINNDVNAVKNVVSAIGFYGDNIEISYGSFGGWDSFGMDRMVTKSKDNILFEIDGKPALELYKSFLGDQAQHLPSSGLLFPLSLKVDERQTAVVRTILSVNEDDQSLTFAGDIPEGASVRLMKANIDRLIDGAITAAETSAGASHGEPALAILISCVGRKLVLKQMVEEEVEGVKDILGTNTTITGFYSYGEISPFSVDKPCELHNQTMTITTFNETL